VSWAGFVAVFGNAIKQNKTTVVYEEGSNILLICSYYPGNSDDLHWYRQYERSKPEFLVLTYGSAKEAAVSDVDPRFSVKVEKREQNHVDLKISSAAVSDSALYYCALRPTTREKHRDRDEDREKEAVTV
uniref:T-cell receptor alpha/delta variable 36.2.12 n=1 Tax=Sinocyclocheilus grahami TaxID=75366 RepID=A0A672Q017_SINGR